MPLSAGTSAGGPPMASHTAAWAYSQYGCCFFKSKCSKESVMEAFNDLSSDITQCDFYCSHATAEFQGKGT